MSMPQSLFVRRARVEDLPILLRLKYLVTHRLSMEDELSKPLDPEWQQLNRTELLNEADPSFYGNCILAGLSKEIIGEEIIGMACLSWFKGPGGNPAKEASIQDQLLHYIPGYLFLSDMAVFSHFRRLGVAAELLAAAEHLALQHGIRGIGLMVDSDNRPALRLYQMAGFRPRAARTHPPMGEATLKRELVLMVKSVKRQKNTAKAA